jgi:DNA-binding response OmpR family regulator
MTKHRLLIVDDLPVNIRILCLALEDEYELAVAESGQKALEIAASFEPNLVLLDVMMPGLDGYETCRRMRSDQLLSATRIIMVSAKAMESDIRRGYEAGAHDYIPKPFKSSELRARVRAQLEQMSNESA